MTQNINLLDVGLQKLRPRVSFATLAYCLAGVVVALFVVQVFLQFQVNGLNGELRRAQEVLTAARAEAQKFTGQAAARKPDPQVEAELAKLQLEFRQAHEAMAALKDNSFGERQGFAGYLRAFSRQSLDGLWLTAFTITGGGELEIRGRALRPDLVPAYIQRLNREDLLAGRSFARFEMNRPGLEAAADKKPAPVTPFLEFSLATREALKRAEKGQ